MAWEFKPGMKVVCVIAKGTRNLVERQIYTISDVVGGRSVSPTLGFSDFYLKLVEAKPNPGDVGFSPQRFRPLRERKTSIECFRALLNTNEKKVDA